MRGLRSWVDVPDRALRLVPAPTPLSGQLPRSGRLPPCSEAIAPPEAIGLVPAPTTSVRAIAATRRAAPPYSEAIAVPEAIGLVPAPTPSSGQSPRKLRAAPLSRSDCAARGVRLGFRQHLPQDIRRGNGEIPPAPKRSHGQRRSAWPPCSLPATSNRALPYYRW